MSQRLCVNCNIMVEVMEVKDGKCICPKCKKEILPTHAPGWGA